MQGERLELTKKELMDLARQHSIKGYSTMSKTELEAAIDAARTEKTSKKGPDTAPRAQKATPTKGKALKVAAEGAALPETTEMVASSESGNKKNLKASAKATTPLGQEQVAPTMEGDALSENAEQETSTQATAEAIAEAEIKEESQALEEIKPKAPPLKQTWTNHQLLIDEDLDELPQQYQDDRAVLLVRDPLWIHAYWDLSPESVTLAKKRGGQRLAMRVHDVSHIIFDGTNSHHHYDLDMPFEQQRIWYLNVPAAGRTYLIEMGFKRADGYFIPLAISNPATTPLAKASEVIQDRFVTLPAPSVQTDLPLGMLERQSRVPAVPAETPAYSEGSLESLPQAPEQPGEGISEDMYALSLRGKPYWSADIPKFGQLMLYPAPSSFLGASWQGEQQRQQQLPAPKAAGAPRKDFWLVANCELIVYGATEPDAHLTVCGQVVDLRSDGTFTLRFELPDGNHPIPIHAVNADRDDERAITITVKRDTAVGLSD